MLSDDQGSFSSHGFGREGLVGLAGLEQSVDMDPGLVAEDPVSEQRFLRGDGSAGEERQGLAELRSLGKGNPG